MSKIINVLKPFRFTHNVAGGRLPVEKVFSVGQHEVSDEIADHPWMGAPSYADGHIETPEAAVKRTQAAKAKAEKAAAEAAQATALAEAAMDRLERSQPETAQKQKLSEEALNTPVGQLRAKQDGDNEEAAKAKGKK